MQEGGEEGGERGEEGEEEEEGEKEEQFFLPFVRKVEWVLALCHLPLSPSPNSCEPAHALPALSPSGALQASDPLPDMKASLLNAAHLGRVQEDSNLMELTLRSERITLAL